MRARGSVCEYIDAARRAGCSTWAHLVIALDSNGELAAPVGVGRRFQGHDVRMRHDAVDAAAIDDGARARALAQARAQARARARARARDDAGGAGGPSANAGDQEREEHLEGQSVERQDGSAACGSVCDGGSGACGGVRSSVGRGGTACV
eukprot:scaffold22284_cov66-Phaeocystis_antarctica.AAC.2